MCQTARPQSELTANKKGKNEPKQQGVKEQPAKEYLLETSWKHDETSWKHDEADDMNPRTRPV